uniref:Cas system-associated protein n=1 Tax=virus sp. ctQmo6 TaxID=2827990 RepID=A0A8S5RGR7_9VIRU|nr:MAG TPA: Cas system-associated protein [virus sp. ctQmo6]
MTVKERKEQIEKVLNKECEKYEQDCTKCPYKDMCNEYIHLNMED